MLTVLSVGAVFSVLAVLFSIFSIGSVCSIINIVSTGTVISIFSRGGNISVIGVGGTFGIMGLCWRCGMGSGNWCLSRDRFVASRPFCKKVVHFYFVRLSRTARGIIWDNRRYSVCISEMCGRGVLVFGARGFLQQAIR